MPDPDYKALCKELVEAYAYLIDRYMTAPSNKDALVYRARAALAQSDPISELVSQCRPLEPEMAEHLTPQARWRLYGDEPQPEPVAPTDEELWEAYDQMDGVPEDWPWCRDYARAVLARWGIPANNTREEK